MRFGLYLAAGVAGEYGERVQAHLLARLTDCVHHWLQPAVSE